MLNRLAIKYLPLDQLIPYSGNARTHSENQVDEIVKSINKRGWTNPILLDGNNGIIAGHGRLLAAKKLGLNEVPTIDLSFASNAQKSEYIIADNKLALNAGWDLDLLRVEFDILENAGIDITDTGFSEEELSSIRNPNIFNEGLCDEDEVPEITESPKTKLGDCWRLGSHWLKCGDSTDSDHVKQLYHNLTPLMMLTDPPYGVKLNQSWRDEAKSGMKLGSGNSNIVSNDDIADWLDTYSLFTGSICYIWHASKFTDIVKRNLEDCDFEVRQMIIWNKSVMVLSRSAYHWKHEPCWYAVKKGYDANWKGDRSQTTVWDAVSPNHIMGGSNEEKTEHPTQKPVLLFEIPLLNHSVPNDIIYDPFCGSGTSIIAAEKLGRACLAMELSPQYCDVIINRWQKFTGKSAILESTQQTFDEVAYG